MIPRRLPSVDIGSRADRDGRVVSRHFTRRRARLSQKRLSHTAPQGTNGAIRMYVVRAAERGPYRFYVRSFHRP